MFAVAFAAAYLAGDLLSPDAVPVAGAVQLSGTTVPATEAPPEGFFVVAPRVVDFSDLDFDDRNGLGDDDGGREEDDDDDDDASSLIRPIGPVTSLDDDDDAPDDADRPIGDGDDSPDDDPNESPDDSIDDDD